MEIISKGKNGASFGRTLSWIAAIDDPEDIQTIVEILSRVNNLSVEVVNPKFSQFLEILSSEESPLENKIERIKNSPSIQALYILNGTEPSNKKTISIEDALDTLERYILSYDGLNGDRILLDFTLSKLLVSNIKVLKRTYGARNKMVDGVAFLSVSCTGINSNILLEIVRMLSESDYEVEVQLY